jgi:hypothetical protein
MSSWCGIAAANGHRSALWGRLRPVLAQRRGCGAGKLARGKVLNDDRADLRQAYALFPGDVAYVWHGAMHGDIVATGLAAWRLAGCSCALRSSGPSNISR